MAEQPLKASVIVLGFNGRQYLADCLSSVSDQDMSPGEYEILYVDNGSTDGSLEFVRSHFPGVHTLALPKNLGFAEGNNAGYRHCRGAHIAFLNQDTVVHRSWLSELVRAADYSVDIAACHSNMIMPWYTAFAAQERSEPVEVLHVADLSRFGFVTYVERPYRCEPVDTLFLAGASVLVKREVLDEWGYAFEPKFFAYCEDTDLALRLRGSGYRNVLVPTSVVYHHHTLVTAPGWATVRKTLRILKNRCLTYYRNMGLLEFVLYSPMLLLGSCFKSREFGLPRHRSLIYAMALVPLTAMAAILALRDFPNHWAERRRILSSRRYGRFWLLQELLGR